METTKKKTTKIPARIPPTFFEKEWNESWTYIKTVVDVLREPILILDKDLRVLGANEPFYNTFQVETKDTEGMVVYELGNGQWNIPALREFLEDILPKNTFFKGFEVAHDFPVIGRKVMILNGRQIFLKNSPEGVAPPRIILLAIEDATEMLAVAEKLSNHVIQFETKLTDRTEKLEDMIEKFEKEIAELKKKH